MVHNNDDALSFDSALEKNRPYLYHLARLWIDPRLRTKLDAADLVQETMLRAYKASDQFRNNPPGELRAKLRFTLLCVLRDLVAAIPDGMEDSSVRLEDSPAAKDEDAPDTSDRALTNERLLMLEAALDALPEREREAVAMRHIHGLTLAEISSHLDARPSVVTGLLRQGLAKLREILPDPEQNDGQSPGKA